ncbi:hypothetical protein N8T08_006740 [Aspergillus melleus]|uniref:Uncharacterized protein n=1 Tax=Aspergillus melleus TaxID=138277 RepID=A0ACC3B022_9EURO|nr:hypothetical protein N8T08_006740 [Aspergillus melleus]
MPVKWTPENDQLLLLKILETHDLSVDPKRVADAWPTTVENGKEIDRPTPRAITERLVRMRKTTCNSNDGHFSISKGNNASGPSTPRRLRAAGPKTPSSRRKRPSPAGDADSNGSKAVEDGNTPTKKPSRLNSNGGQLGQIGSALKLEATLKVEDDDEVSFVGQESPVKRLRKASALPSGMVSYKVDDDDDDEDADEDMESSASEYTPDHVREENEDLYV